MIESCAEYTTFLTRTITCQFEMMLFRLMSAPSTFQHIMHAVLKFINVMQSYLEDVVVHSKTVHRHITYLQKVSAVIIAFRLKLKISQCESVKNKVGVLGHIVSSVGVVANP